ncbi:ABC transporter substrate-binding protein [Reyranella sp.]|jgi:putative ABC transport system substrate-binding protein|uniref:ABC transporter substrate-binding protein n=1 Tax=Reyranella sp. TaxID=1929291 RepID=UPI002F9396ED
MRRRQILTTMGVGATLLSLGSRAQSRHSRVGVLMAVGQTPEYLASVAAFEAVLAQRGWHKGDNLEIDVRWSAGAPDRTPRAIGEILALQPDVIVAQSEAVVKALQVAKPVGPVVFVHVSDPIASGIAKSLSRPEGNITGFTNSTPSLGGKWLQLLKQAAPSVKRAAMLFNPATAATHGALWLKPFMAAGPPLGVETLAAEVHDAREIETALTALGERNDGGFVAIPDAFLAGHSKEIVSIARRHRLPAVYPYRYYAAQGGLLSYGVDNKELYEKAATYVDRLLKGETAADLPIQEPTSFRLVINAHVAKAFGLDVSPLLLGEADEVLD